MNELQRLSRNLIAVIINYSNSKERELIDSEFNIETFPKLQSIVDDLGQSSIRHALFPYFMHILFQILVINHPDCYTNNEEKRTELKEELKKFFRALQALLDTPQSGTQTITYKDQTVDIPGFQNGYISQSLTKLGKLVSIFLAPYRLTKLDEEVGTLVESSLIMTQHEGLKAGLEVLKQDRLKIMREHELQIKTYVEKYKQLETSTVQLTQVSREDAKTIASLNHQITERNQQIQVLSQTVTDCRELHEELKKKNEELEACAQQAQENISKLEKKVQECLATNMLLTNTIEDYQKRNVALKNSVQEKEKTIAGQQRQINVFTQAVHDKEKERPLPEARRPNGFFTHAINFLFEQDGPPPQQSYDD